MFVPESVVDHKVLEIMNGQHYITSHLIIDVNMKVNQG